MASGRLRQQPGGVGWRVVHVEAEPMRQPGPDLGVLVGAVVIDGQVQLQILGHLLVDPPQEAQELLVPVPWLELGDHRTGGHIQRQTG